MSNYLSFPSSLLQIVIDSIASLAKKEGLNEQDKETYILRQVIPSSYLSNLLLVKFIKEIV